jgi:hypothetical protein
MIKNIKNHLLTYLFSDWIKNEKDVNNIISLKNTLQTQQNELTGYKPIIGFTQNRNKITIT